MGEVEKLFGLLGEKKKQVEGNNSQGPQSLNLAG